MLKSSWSNSQRVKKKKNLVRLWKVAYDKIFPYVNKNVLVVNEIMSFLK